MLPGVEECRRAFVEALLGRNSARARRVVEEAVAGGAAVPDVYLGVLQPALYEIGHRWAVGELSVAEEHYATAIVQSLLETLSARIRVAPKDGRLAVVGGTPGELHALGARMVADFLEADGWEVINLGAGVPAEDLLELVDAERPDVVGLSTSTAGGLPGIQEVVERLAALDPRPVIAVGGQFWTRETGAAALEFGADLVTRDPRALTADLRGRLPPVDE
jgi:methanogenic corrinoid protein MtbC1